MKKGKLIYKTKAERGYVARAWELTDGKGNALIQIAKSELVVREFLFPAYKAWNIAAHLPDIVDSELAKNRVGYAIAASIGFGFVEMKPVESSGRTVNVVQQAKAGEINQQSKRRLTMGLITCGNGHKEVAYEERGWGSDDSCPVCTAKEETAEQEKKVAELEKENNECEEKVTALQEKIEEIKADKKSAQNDLVK